MPARNDHYAPGRLTRDRRRFFLPLAIAALLAALFSAYAAHAAQAQAPTPSDNDVNRVAHQLYCPVCQNIPLDVCPTEACAKWRATIHDKLAAGWTDQQILDYFVAQYGERVLANPSTRGLNFLIWLVPPIVVAGGVVFLWQFVRHSAMPPQAPANAETPPAADPYVEQFEKELEKRR
jgi:cytochrome c-type biogenesis protein CcmH